MPFCQLIYGIVFLLRLESCKGSLFFLFSFLNMNGTFKSKIVFLPFSLQEHLQERDDEKDFMIFLWAFDFIFLLCRLILQEFLFHYFYLRFQKRNFVERLLFAPEVIVFLSKELRYFLLIFIFLIFIFKVEWRIQFIFVQ